MTTTPDTDFAQFEDAMSHKRRVEDQGVEATCDEQECPAIFILERRVDRHREEINEIKKLVEKNSADTAEVLEIVTTAKSFFKVLGWLGEKAKTIMALVGFFGAFFLWLKSGGTKP